MLWLFFLPLLGTVSFQKDKHLRVWRGLTAKEQTLLVRTAHCEGTHTCRRQRLTLELLASQTQHRLAAVLLIRHPRTRSFSLSFRRVPPVSDMAKQDIGRAQQPTDDGTYRVMRRERGQCDGDQAEPL